MNGCTTIVLKRLICSNSGVQYRVVKLGRDAESITPCAARDVDFETCRPVLKTIEAGILNRKSSSKGKWSSSV
jgi:hypothetical protein